MVFSKWNLAALENALEPDYNQRPTKFMGMFYGDNGSGKSKLALEVAADITPVSKKILYVDTSSGFQTIRNHPDLDAKLRGRMLLLHFDGEIQLKELGKALRSHAGGFGNVATLVLDEASTMGQYILDVVVEGRAQADDSKEENFATRPDYAIAGNKFRYIMQQFQSIPTLNLLTVAHYRTDEVKGFQKLSPAFQPQVGNAIRAELEMIGFCELKEVKTGKDVKLVRQVQVWGTNLALAKTRVQLDGKPMPTELPPEEVQRAIREYVLSNNTSQVSKELEPVEV